MKFVGTYETGYEHWLKRYCFGYRPRTHLKNTDPDTALQNIWQTLSFWVTVSKLTVLESLDLTDFKSVFESLVRCLDPDLKCLDPDSSNVGRGSKTLSANLSAIILFASYEHFLIWENKAIIHGYPKKIWISILCMTSNKGIRRYFVLGFEFLSDSVGAYNFRKLRPYRF